MIDSAVGRSDFVLFTYHRGVDECQPAQPEC